MIGRRRGLLLAGTAAAVLLLFKSLSKRSAPSARQPALPPVVTRIDLAGDFTAWLDTLPPVLDRPYVALLEALPAGPP